uniref:Hikeshi-like domain-containing protein n=1 Tax=Setaria digitata TaxID=48799 RepID=A0A915Q232_9BILA
MENQLTKVFGVITAGRPVRYMQLFYIPPVMSEGSVLPICGEILIQTDFVQVSRTEFVIEMGDSSSANHVVVFLTGIAPFPADMAGSVYIRWPKIGTETNWHYLGYIANDKPSAIFRVAQLHKMDAVHGGLFVSNLSTSGSVAGNAQIGISVEPLAVITSKVPAEGTTVSQQSSFMEFAEKMLQNFVNHLQSFAVRLPRPENPGESTDFISASAVQRFGVNDFTYFLSTDMNPSVDKLISFIIAACGLFVVFVTGSRMASNNICQSHFDLSAQIGVTSYDISSLVDDDFEVIGSLTDTLRSMSLETSSEVPLYDIQIGNGVDTVTGKYSGAGAGTNEEADNTTPLANNSLKADDDIDGKTNIEMLRRRLDEEIAQKIHFSAELEETQRVLNECRMKVDEEVAGKIERDDIIKVLQATVIQLRNSGDLSCFGSNVANEQALASSLHEKDQLIEALKKQLEEAEERYEREHKEVLDLEEIVKILHEYIQNDQPVHIEQLQ